MEIFIDGDACPVVSIIEDIARKYDIKSTIVSDHNHLLSSEYSEVVITDMGADSADFLLINLASADDVVITQDYGVAVMALTKSIHAIDHFGVLYTNSNIDILLNQKHLSGKIRRSSKRNNLKGPKKRTVDDDKNFEKSFDALISSLI